MKILGIDTTTKFLCLGIYDGANVYEYNLEVARRLSSLISVTIQRVLGALDLAINEIDYFACGLGPGSFTGIRLGLATIKGLSWPLKKPIVGISTLDILAKNTRQSDGYTIPLIDAKRNLIYCSIYKTKNGTLKRITPYMLLTIDEFFRKIKHKTLNIKRTLIFGDAVSLYKENILSNIKGATILDKDYWYPQPHNIINLALERIKEKKTSGPFDIQPIYLYPKECQIANTDKRGLSV